MKFSAYIKTLLDASSSLKDTFGTPPTVTGLWDLNYLGSLGVSVAQPYLT